MLNHWPIFMFFLSPPDKINMFFPFSSSLFSFVLSVLESNNPPLKWARQHGHGVLWQSRQFVPHNESWKAHFLLVSSWRVGMFPNYKRWDVSLFFLFLHLSFIFRTESTLCFLLAQVKEIPKQMIVGPL